jgi:hypothetical protein
MELRIKHPIFSLCLLGMCLGLAGCENSPPAQAERIRRSIHVLAGGGHRRDGRGQRFAGAKRSLVRAALSQGSAGRVAEGAARPT